MNGYFKYCKNIKNKGSSAVLVLAVILIIISLGTIALSGALTSLKLSSKYKNAGRDFYSLDSLGAERLACIDELLEIAEEAAAGYIKNEFYTKNSHEEVNIPKISWFDPMKALDLSQSGMQQDIYEYWNQNVLSKSYTGDKIKTLDEKIYNINLSSFNEKIYTRLYFFFCQKVLENYLTMAQNANFYTVSLSSEARRYLNNENWYEFESYEFKKEDLKIIFSLEETEDIYEKIINAVLCVNVPQIKSLTVNTQKAVKGNPVWANAITAGGAISVNQGNTTIYGDIYAASTPASKGIYTTSGGKLTVYGNGYTSGQVSIDSPKGEMFFGFYDDLTKVNYKNVMYQKTIDGQKANKYLYADISSFASTEDEILNFYNYTGVHNENWLIKSMENDADNVIPMFYYDGKISSVDETNRIMAGDTQTGGGNLYAGNVYIGSGMDSIISIQGNAFVYSGMTVESGRSIIEIGNNLINMTEAKVESLSPYTAEGTTDSYIRVLNSFILPGGGVIQSKYMDFLQGFSGGTLFASSDEDLTKMTEVYSDDIVGQRENSEAFEKMSDIMKSYFNTKTRTLGLTGLSQAYGGITSLVNEASALSAGNKDKKYIDGSTGFLYFGDSTLTNFYEINSESCGIIYSKGNLRLSGDGVFRGAVICEGNVIVEGNPTIYYDEDIISRILGSDNKIAKDFFAKGEFSQGSDIFADMMRISGYVRSNTSRYFIKSWVEGRQ